MLILIVFHAGFVRSNGRHACGKNVGHLSQLLLEIGRMLRAEALGQALVNHQRISHRLERFFVGGTQLRLLGMDAGAVLGQALEVIPGGDLVY